MSFKDKVVLVIGASSGIGAATAVAFAKEDAKVILVGRNEAKLANTSKKCEKDSKQPLVIKADISKDCEAESVIDKTIERYGKLDVLINNAGILRYGSLIAGDLMKTYDETMNTNLRALVNLTCLAVPYLIKTKGNVINISSSITERPHKSNLFLNYGLSKAGLNFFTQAAALELSPHGVRVNAICPGPVRSDIFEGAGGLPPPNPGHDVSSSNVRFAEPEEMADFILFVASDKAKNMTGGLHMIDDGYSVKH